MIGHKNIQMNFSRLINKLWIMLFIITPLLAQNFGKLVTPEQTIPIKYVGNNKGYLSINFLINNNGLIEGWKINSILLIARKSKRPVEVFGLYRNTIIGKKLAKRLKPWAMDFAKQCRFEKDLTWDIKKEGGIWGVKIGFGFSPEEKKKRELDIEKFIQENKDKKYPK